MKKKQNVIPKNYLDKIPVHASHIRTVVAEDGIVTLDIENKGAFNKLAQKLFKRPQVSHIHLDEFGSFVWLTVDGKRSIYELGEDVKAHFGERAEPLYERLAKYFQILESYKFIYFSFAKEK